MTETEPTDQQDLLLIDSRHLLWRAASVLFDLNIQQTDGKVIATGGVYGFLRILVSSWRRYHGTVIACWDRHDGPSERRKIYAQYKAKPLPDKGTPKFDRASAARVERELIIESMKDQEATLKRLLSLLGVRQASSPGWEADDVIATLCTRYPNYKVGVLSGDRDLLQLVTDNVSVIRPQPKGSFEICTPALVAEQFGFSPAQILDYKSLAGDAGDNIPGAKGIGEKTATKLLQEHGSWRQCLTWAEANTTKPSTTQAKLIASRDQIEMSAKLVALNRAAPLEFIDQNRNVKQAFIELASLKLNTLMADGRMDSLTAMGG